MELKAQSSLNGPSQLIKVAHKRIHNMELKDQTMIFLVLAGGGVGMNP